MRPHHTRSAGTATFVFHPSYSNPTSITEGTTYSYYIQTTGVSNGTTLYWSITHGTTTNADFSANSGSFTVNNNLGIFNIFPTNENTQDNGETFTLTIRTGSINGPIVLSRAITVNDPAPYAVVQIQDPIEEGIGYNVGVYIYNVYSNDYNVQFNWQILNNTTNNQDWNSNTSGYFFASNYGSYRYGSFAVYPKDDGIAEDDEHFGFHIQRADTGQVVYSNFNTSRIKDPEPYVDMYAYQNPISEYVQNILVPRNAYNSQPQYIDIYIHNENANATYQWTAFNPQGLYVDISPSSGYFTSYNQGSYRAAQIEVRVYGINGTLAGQLQFSIQNLNTGTILYGPEIQVAGRYFTSYTYMSGDPCGKINRVGYFYTDPNTGQLYEYTRNYAGPNHPFEGWLGTDVYQDHGVFEQYVNGYLNASNPYKYC